MPIETLTDARVRSAAPPQAGRLELWDSQNLGALLSCHDVRRSLLDFSLPARQRLRLPPRHALGRYPALSLVDARGAAERLRDRVRTGADPQQEQAQRPRGAAGGTAE